MKREHWHLGKANAKKTRAYIRVHSTSMVCAFGPSYIILSTLSNAYNFVLFK